MLPGFKPKVDLTPSIRPHRSDLDLIWIGDATYCIADVEKMVTDSMRAVAEQRRRAWELDSQLTHEVGAA